LFSICISSGIDVQYWSTIPADELKEIYDIV
jgi:hypothetical protein